MAIHSMMLSSMSRNRGTLSTPMMDSEDRLSSSQKSWLAEKIFQLMMSLQEWRGNKLKLKL
jgi:hypothetical protein